MSNRVLKKLQGDDDLDKLKEELQLTSSEDEETVQISSGNKKPTLANAFDLLGEEDDVEEDHSPIENHPEPSAESLGTKPRKKKTKKKAKNVKTAVEDEIDLDDVELQENPHFASNGTKPVKSRYFLSIEKKDLDPENELRRIFGARVVQKDQKRRVRGRIHIKPTWLVTPNMHWAQMGKSGLSCSIDCHKDNCTYFKYEHKREYRKIQQQFWAAVDSLNPENIIGLVNAYPYHIDSLLQLSDICRMGDDVQTAAELIERALFVLESALPPSFNFAAGTCRLEYRIRENRALFLALFKHLTTIGQKSCYRTALEFCKLLYSLDPEADPLAVVLMIDFYAIKAQEYAWLIEFFNELEPVKNLSQLPNFAYSIALAYFYLKDEEESKMKAEEMLVEAILMFPGVLTAMLDKCSIQADARVLGNEYFSQTADSQSPALNQLVQLYVGRTYHVWKDPCLLPWLETASNKAVSFLEDPANAESVSEYTEKRKRRYQGSPRNILRHIILSEIKDATATLPADLAETPLMGFDPLPPTDSVDSYARVVNRVSEQGLLSSFFRSLMPSYNPNATDGPIVSVGFGDDNQAAGGGEEGTGEQLRRSVNSLVSAMRDLLTNIHLPDVTGNEEDRDDDGSWTDDSIE
uniref:EOG090X0BCY n=1 Tax=Lynceus sp. MCZ IZ 141354 TaxID=1930659 RepID=A0A9N6ZFP7_9CRUS|nr:EOG090X0BCY [Lynceus sp. MCZ IZ 141354]